MYENNYQNLGNAIIAKACEDYYDAIINGDTTVEENIKKFFYSKWCTMYNPQIEGEVIERRTRERALKDREVKRMIKELTYIAKHYGERHQQEKAIEEMSELMVAIRHEDRNNYLEELADVQIMLEQLFLLLPAKQKQKVESIKKKKIERQLQRIQEENVK